MSVIMSEIDLLKKISIVFIWFGIKVGKYSVCIYWMKLYGIGINSPVKSIWFWRVLWVEGAILPTNTVFLDTKFLYYF